jgi:hypothetical protein
VAKKKPEKYYTVRVVNPSRPGPARSIAVPGREASTKTKNPSSCHVCTKSNPRERNASIDSYERSVLEALQYDAEEVQNDWGISQSVANYLEDVDAGTVEVDVLYYLQLVQSDITTNYEAFGDEDDPDLSRRSAQWADAQVVAAIEDIKAHRRGRNPRRSGKPKTRRTGSYTVTTTKHTEELEVRIMPTMAYSSGEPVELWIPLDNDRNVEMAQRGGDRDIEFLLAQAHYDEYGNEIGRRRNPSFRYAAVPVDDAGHETVYVARGHRRADMLSTVARAVPGDADVDLQHTRTFATKHEATKYAKTMSPRVVALSRRMKNP